MIDLTEVDNDNKRLEQAKKVMKKFFKEHPNESFSLGYLYNHFVGYSEKELARWAFVEVLNEMVENGELKEEPVLKTEIMDYEYTYKE